MNTLKDVQEDPVDAQRMQRVKEAMVHAWSSYEKYAWGQDELQVHSMLLSFEIVWLAAMT